MHPPLRDSSHPDCCSRTKKSTAARPASLQIQKASSHVRPSPSSRESAPPPVCFSCGLPECRLFPPPAATHSKARTTIDSAQSSATSQWHVASLSRAATILRHPFESRPPARFLLPRKSPLELSSALPAWPRVRSVVPPSATAFRCAGSG